MSAARGTVRPPVSCWVLREVIEVYSSALRFGITDIL